MPLQAGARLGPYEILAPLGAGGMGEVYRARDGRLRRDVAIKILPESFASDADRLMRFEREAQTLAALNHPHIAAIYGVQATDAGTALVLELVEGPTLADRIARGAVPLREALGIGLQIATAVEAAHDRAIVHRDLKPANIKVTPDGIVKVLDFGLAKAVTGDSATPALTESPTISGLGTRAGVLLGTAAYMSPEQARGLAVDTRSDVWAFGCVLYELLTRRAVFNGNTVTDVLAAVVNGEPDWSLLPTDTPVAIQRLLRRALEKDHKRRLRHIGDARLEIEDALAAPATGKQPPGARSRWLLLPWLAAAAGLSAAGWFAVTRGDREVDGLASLQVERLTSDAGLTTMPAVSRDGRLTAYASDRAGRGDLDIWVQLAEGSPLRLTDDPADDLSPHFSPDGNQVAFRSERAGGGVYVVATLGGKPRLIGPEGRSPQFSPDGSRIAYWSGSFRGGSTALSSTYVTPLGGGERVRLLTEFETARDPVWAPDGRSLLVAALARRLTGPAEVDWWWTSLDGGPPTQTGAARFAAVKAALSTTERAQWTAEGLLFGDGRDLWMLPLGAKGRVVGSPRRLTVGAQNYSYPSAASDGRIAFASTVTHRMIGRAAISVASDAPAPVALYEDAQETAGRVSQTTDGSRIVFERGSPDGREIWMKALTDGSEQLIARVGERSLLNATVSPDGSKVAYAAGTTGYVVDTKGGVPRSFCTECMPFGFLSDNRRVLVQGRAPGTDTIRLTDVLTGMTTVVVQVADGQLNRPHASPDDRWIAFRREAAEIGKTFVAPLRLDRPVTIDEALIVDEPTSNGRPAGWSLDSRTVYLLLDTDGWRCLWAQAIDGAGRFVGVPVPARHFHGVHESSFGTSYGNAISAAGLLYEGDRKTANIWLLHR